MTPWGCPTCGDDPFGPSTYSNVMICPTCVLHEKAVTAAVQPYREALGKLRKAIADTKNEFHSPSERDEAHWALYAAWKETAALAALDAGKGGT